MCGIYGQINKSKSIDKEMFLKALNTLEKRGPDTFGTYFKENIGLGHRRLSIIDLSDSGKQPMFNEIGSVSIVFNGELYNYKEIKENLKQTHAWKSSTDTEVLIHAYEEFGLDVFKFVHGMFALCLLDEEKGEIVLARDQFGKKPLYYYFDNEYFIFSSEPKAIVKNKFLKTKLEIDELSLSKFLFYGYVPSPNSIIKQIKKLEPSTYLRFSYKKWNVEEKKTYWYLENVKINKDIDEREILEKLDDLIGKSVEKRLMSDVPLGFFLSGGVDSSLIAYYLSKKTDKVGAYTVSYNIYKEADESSYARRVASTLGIKLDFCYLEDALVKENFIEVMNYLDEPLADPAIVPLYFLSKNSRKEMTVVLSGDGGDEVFGGYEKYRAQNFIEKNKYLKFLAYILKPVIGGGSKYSKMFEMYGEDFEKRQFIFGSGSPLEKDVSALLGKEINMDRIFEEASFYNHLYKNNDPVNRSMYLDCKIQLPDWYLVKGDRATMANSQEMRNPFLDKDLAEFAFSLEGKWKLRNGEPKYLLKKLASQHFDRDIIYRAKKGFGVPLDRWIRNELKDLFDEYLFTGSKIFDKNVVNNYYQEHITGNADHRFLLFRIFCFNYWYKNWFEKI